MAGRTARAQPAHGSLVGQLLVAAPGMRDPRFARTVIVIVRHDATGAMGVTVNRSIGRTPLAELLQRLGVDPAGVSGSIRVHWGGPVDRARGFVLHTTDYTDEGTIAAGPRFALTASLEVLRRIGLGRGPRRTLFVLGYAGWAPGQLEAERERGDWVVAPPDDEVVFDDNHAGKWERALAQQKIDL
ncbi:MAG: YqgE/AlgH family protein [Candidatus Rokubacteria bacterium]|nr:YqgE/AlgH family protein [Candidatus Rokubacteria bacterium]